MNTLLHDVLISNLDRPETPNGAPLLRAMVKQITEAGDVLVEIPDEPTRPLLCDVMFGGVPLVLSVDDVVILWTPSAANERGIILGRVGRYAAPGAATKKQLSLEASESLSLKCGASSLELRSDGRVLLKGKDIVSRAERTQRIKGGTVAIN